jgi:putative cell wall-binding protein
LKDRLSRYRRGATALLLGIGAIGGVVGAGLASGVAFAADSLAVGSTISAVSAPSLPSTGTNQAGNLDLSIASGSTISSGDTIELTLTPGTTSAGTVDWASNPVVSANGITVTAETGAGSSTETLTLGALPSGGSATIDLSNVVYDTSGAEGSWTVVAGLYTSSGVLVGTFSPSTGVANATFPGVPTGFVLTAGSTPTISSGVNDQAAGNFNLGLYGADGESWTAGETVTIAAEVPGTTTNCTGTFTAPQEVGFATTPTASVTAVSGDVSTTPTVSVSLAQSSACSGTSNDDELVVKFTNSGTLTNSTATTYSSPSATITLSGVEYDVTTATPGGLVPITATSTGTTVVDGADVAVTSLAVAATTGPSNADVSPVALVANTPPVVLASNLLSGSISNIEIKESAADQVGSGTVTATLAATSGTTPTFVGSPTVSVSGGAATVGTTVTGTGTDALSFTVTAPSSTGPATYTLSNLAVDTSGTGAGPVTVKVTFTAGSGTPTATSPIGPVTAFTVGQATQIYGQTANATAAAEFETAFPYGKGDCPATGAAVLATSQFYSDALVASYMAENLGTGILLTDTNTLSSSALTALRLEGITTVYVVGGPDAVSSAVVNQLESTPSYTCGGTSERTLASGATQDLKVVQTEGQTYGQTLFGTSKDIAEYFGSGAVGSLSIDGAYGMYNNTTPAGNETSAPNTTAALPTAIVATGGGFQDAISASGLAYAEHLPILLAPTSTMPASLQTTGMNDLEAAINDLGIKQVIVVGGPDAVSNTVVSDLESSTGVSVLRIAGQDYTATATELADFEANASLNSAGEAEGLGNSASGATVDYGKIATVAVARGDFYTDALAGSPITGGVVDGAAPTTDTPIPQLLTENPSTVGQYLTTFLNGAGTVGIDNQSTDIVSSLKVFGGPEAVQPSTISAMENDLNG